MNAGAGEPTSEDRDRNAPPSKAYVDSAAETSRSAPGEAAPPPPANDPDAPTAEGADLFVGRLRADLDGLKRTVDDLRARAAPGDAHFVAALEGCHARLNANLASLESRLGESPSVRREAWDAALKDTSEKMRRGAGELGTGLGRAWREMRAAAGKAWEEFRREDTQTPKGQAGPPEPRSFPDEDATRKP